MTETQSLLSLTMAVDQEKINEAGINYLLESAMSETRAANDWFVNFMLAVSKQLGQQPDKQVPVSSFGDQ